MLLLRTPARIAGLPLLEPRVYRRIAIAHLRFRRVVFLRCHRTLPFEHVPRYNQYGLNCNPDRNIVVPKRVHPGRPSEGNCPPADRARRTLSGVESRPQPALLQVSASDHYAALNDRLCNAHATFTHHACALVMNTNPRSDCAVPTPPAKPHDRRMREIGDTKNSLGEAQAD